MNLSSELISEFAKLSKNNSNSNSETTLGGEIRIQNGVTYVQLDGNEETGTLTPVHTTAAVKNGERVMVLIKNHTATVIGNMTAPSASSTDVEEMGTKINDFDIIIADKVSTKDFQSQVGRIDTLFADNVIINETVTANTALVNTIKAENVVIRERLTASEGSIQRLNTTKLDARVADITYATIEDLDATNIDVYNLEAAYSNFKQTTTNRLNATEATIENLDTTYANIDFSNIGKAAMEYFYSQSGLIENVVIDNATIAGYLIGVTIKGELLEAGTVIADKLVIKGEDGLYYKLNTNGEDVDSEQTDYNSLNGKIITAKSITAEKVAVEDLVAFDATIGGFNITDKAIYSEVKDSEGNTTRGVYMDSDGQVNIGDETNYIKYYLAEDGTYKLVISADTIMYDVNGNQYSIADLGIIGEYIKISTYEGEPCIELGETDSDFKLLITNTRIMFMEGSGVPAYINNQSLFIKKAVIEEELQQGEFIWKARANGNLGLIWKGAAS